MAKASTVAAITGATVVGGLLAYAVYFDHKRRTNATFRRRLREDKKKIREAQQKDSEASEAQAKAGAKVSAEDLRAIVEQMKGETYPQRSEEQEAFFMSEVNQGELLSVQGPSAYLQAAIHFYRALKVYPSQMELLMIYQKTVPEPVLMIVMELYNLEVSSFSPSGSRATGASALEVDEEEATSPKQGPPSEASSQEWDTVTDLGSQHLS